MILFTNEKIFGIFSQQFYVHGGHGVVVTQQVVVLLSWVQFPLATPHKNDPNGIVFV